MAQLVHVTFTAVMLAAAVLAGRHAAREGKAAFFLGAVVYGYALEQVAILVFDLYTYPLDSFVMVLFDVPVAISLGWAAIIYTGTVVGRSFSLSGLPLAAFTGLFSLHIDVVMDPIAARVLLWTWIAPAEWFGVPLENFLGWFFVAALYVYGHERLTPRIRNVRTRSVVVVAAAVPFLVLLVDLWLRVVEGVVVREAAVLSALLAAAALVVARAHPHRGGSPPAVLFAAVMLFHVFFAAVYLVQGMVREIPAVLPLLVLMAAVTAALFHRRT